MKAHTKETQATMTPAKALNFLKEGNERFVSNLKINRNLLEQVNDTSDGQFPFATILSCIDSRTSAELIFDQGLGDIFSIRIAGNIINDDILGSMEFACKVAGSKLVMVLGHTNCGAIKGACDAVEMGNLSTLLSKIKPAVADETETTVERSSKNGDFVQNVANINVKNAVRDIPQRSAILKEMLENGQINIVGGMYDVKTGIVEIY